MKVLSTKSKVWKKETKTHLMQFKLIKSTCLQKNFHGCVYYLSGNYGLMTNKNQKLLWWTKIADSVWSVSQSDAAYALVFN